jgi:hypothetical protein
MESYQPAASCVVVMLGLCQIKCSLCSLSGRDSDSASSSVYTNTVTTKTALQNALLLAYSALLVFWFDLREVVFPMAVLFAISLFLPYLRKCSKYRQKSVGGARARSCGDKLILTSSAYMVGALYAAYSGIWWLACICAITCTGEMLYDVLSYHRYAI